MSTPIDWEPTDHTDDGGPIYEVEHILDQQGEGSGARFLIKWKGFPESDATWEPLSHLTNCAHLLREFRKNRNRQQRPKTPPRSVRPPSASAEQP